MAKTVLLPGYAKDVTCVAEPIVQEDVFPVENLIVELYANGTTTSRVQLFQNRRMFATHAQIEGNARWIEHTTFHIRLMQWQKNDILIQEAIFKLKMKN